MVDPVSEFLPNLGSRVQNAAFAAPPLPNVPAAVMSSGKFVPPNLLTPENYTQAQIHRSNDLLADALHATNHVVADSGHNIMLYDPAAVVRTVEAVQARLG